MAGAWTIGAKGWVLHMDDMFSCFEVTQKEDWKGFCI